MVSCDSLCTHVTGFNIK